MVVVSLFVDFCGFVIGGLRGFVVLMGYCLLRDAVCVGCGCGLFVGGLCVCGLYVVIALSFVWVGLVVIDACLCVVCFVWYLFVLGGLVVLIMLLVVVWLFGLV